jgi:shikimate kinase
MAWVKRHGTTIYLDTPPEILFERLKNERERRPLLKNLSEPELKNFIRERLEEREPFYRQADFVWNQDSGASNYLQKILMLIRPE